MMYIIYTQEYERLTFEVTSQHILPERLHVSDAERRTGAGPHDHGRGLFLRNREQRNI